MAGNDSTVLTLKAQAANTTAIGDALKQAEEELEANPTEKNLQILSDIRDLYREGVE